MLTLYAFSMENWQRPPDEIQSLMALLVDYLRSERQEMLDNGIRLRVIGKPEDLRHQIQALLRETMEMTACNTDMILNLGISYSGRSEIVRAVGRLLADADAGRVNPKDLSEEMFSSYLDTQGLPDPDLLIRTSGEQRISNFLLWQMAYTEIYFTDTLWPDFSEDELLKALRDFEGRDRRFGRIAGPTPEP